MGRYRVILSREAEVQLSQIKRSGVKSTIKKITTLISELEETPREGTGRPEQLRHGLAGKWSRRLNKKSRLIYSINEEENEVVIYALVGHYADK